MSYNVRKLISQKIKKARTIAIFMHNSPDGDCIGSAVALEEACKMLGKNVDVIIQDKIAEKFSPIIGEKRVNRIIKPKEGKKYDLSILLDCADLNRTSHFVKTVGRELIIIDHHPVKNELVGDVYLHEQESATGIILYKLLNQLGIKINQKIATALYFSIASDTNFFKNENTNTNSHDVSGKLLNHGADSSLIVEIMESKSKNFYTLLGTVIHNINYHKRHKILTLLITKDNINSANATYGDAALIVDYIKEIEGFDVVLLFIEGISNVRIRARSKTKDVNKILSYFGGGGHEKAAGCAIEGKSVSYVVEEVTNYAKECIGSV